MIVYHGSTQEISCPNISFSKRNLDFGRGFYLTSYQKQAENWAKKKGLRQKKGSIVNVYELSESWDAFKVLHFAKEDEKWLDFVCACRNGEELYKEYDIIIGNVANDDIFKTVDMYFRGLWDKNRTLQELRYYKQNDQICIVNQTVLEQIVTFKESYKVADEFRDSSVEYGKDIINKKQLEYVYKQNLDNDIIQYLAECLHIELRKAMDIYYNSQLSGQIALGLYGIENMDYRYLVEDLIENESVLFSKETIDIS